MLDAFRSINPLAVNPRLCAPTAEARQTTSNMGHLVRPSLVSTVHGLGLRYYSLNCAYKLTTREQKMLSRLNQKTWLDGMDIQSDKPASNSEQQIKRYGRLNAKQKLEQLCNEIMADNIVQELSTVISTQSLQ
ncbi:hypothetical protein ANCCAN_03267 [Ancylostoma caninum]|uniref:Uncharacterized protein n=1 Tax=Ancylostoma caninum TaxID=29170 RepID=A0A368H233_ANCCA|nr:hypothetical protein ANCCAN_03267 [Ancylostoma caninum]